MEDRMEFVYETHLHTIEGSACSRTWGEEYAEYMKALGYSGMIVTDHFFNGNSAVPKNLPWKERVERYCEGYEHAKEASNDDFTVLFGVEYNFSGDEYLLYGITKEWLLDNPDILEKDRFQVYEMIHSCSGIMIHAHPYRERGYLSAIHLTPGICDGVEVYNGANPDYQNALGYEYAQEHNFPMSAGSDIHYFGQEYMGGMSFPYPIKTIEDFVNSFKDRKGVPVYKKISDGNEARFRPVVKERALTGTLERPKLEVIWH